MKRKKSPHKTLYRRIIKLCHLAKVPKYDYERGCKLFDNHQRICILILLERSGKSLRRFAEEFSESLWSKLLKVKKEICKSTLHDWRKRYSTSFIRKLVKLSLINKSPKITAIDGTGIETQYKSAYYSKKVEEYKNKGIRTKASWHKLDIICDINSKQIIDFSFLLKDRHDTYVAYKIVKRITFSKAIVLADKGYYCFDLFEMFKQKDNQLVVPPKNYGEKTRHRKIIRRKFHNTYYEYENLYGFRSIVESVFSSLKRVQGLRMRCRKGYMKKREMAWNILWYNLRITATFFSYLFQLLQLKLIMKLHN